MQASMQATEMAKVDRLHANADWHCEVALR
eukprot:SAG31_NODE_31051_length_373_cov_0.408759_1_plen_29_part_01